PTCRVPLSGPPACAGSCRATLRSDVLSPAALLFRCALARCALARCTFARRALALRLVLLRLQCCAAQAVFKLRSCFRPRGASGAALTGAAPLSKPPSQR